jgi:hypothetical protein
MRKQQLYKDIITACKAYNAETDDEDDQIVPIHLGDIPQDGILTAYGETLVEVGILDEDTDEQIALRSSAN